MRALSPTIQENESQRHCVVSGEASPACGGRKRGKASHNDIVRVWRTKPVDTTVPTMAIFFDSEVLCGIQMSKGINARHKGLENLPTLWLLFLRRPGLRRASSTISVFFFDTGYRIERLRNKNKTCLSKAILKKN